MCIIFSNKKKFLDLRPKIYKMVEQVFISLPPMRRGYHLVTRHIVEQLPRLPEKGLLNIFLRHTSAALAINENADPTVRQDFETVMDALVPDGTVQYEHNLEGEDDMPAHIKSAMFGVSLSIPIANGKLALGTWQGIYLCEFRNGTNNRNLIATIVY